MTLSKIALAAALVLGTASVTLAADRDDNGYSGGYRVGPLGQSFDSGVNPVHHRSLHGRTTGAEGAYARAPQSHSE
jgi:hypothetical protein